MADPQNWQSVIEPEQPKKGLWQRIKDWYNRHRPQRDPHGLEPVPFTEVMKAKFSDWYHGPYEQLHKDVSPELRGFSKAAMLAMIPLAFAVALYSSTPGAFQRHYPPREINFRPLARSEIFYKDGKYAIRYFNPDFDYTSDKYETLDKAVRLADQRAGADWAKQRKTMDAICGADRDVTDAELEIEVYKTKAGKPFTFKGN